MRSRTIGWHSWGFRCHFAVKQQQLFPQIVGGNFTAFCADNTRLFSLSPLNALFARSRFIRHAPLSCFAILMRLIFRCVLDTMHRVPFIPCVLVALTSAPLCACVFLVSLGRTAAFCAVSNFPHLGCAPCRDAITERILRFSPRYSRFHFRYSPSLHRILLHVTSSHALPAFTLIFIGTLYDCICAPLLGIRCHSTSAHFTFAQASIA